MISQFTKGFKLLYLLHKHPDKCLEKNAKDNS